MSLKSKDHLGLFFQLYDSQCEWRPGRKVRLPQGDLVVRLCTFNPSPYPAVAGSLVHRVALFLMNSQDIPPFYMHHSGYDQLLSHLSTLHRTLFCPIMIFYNTTYYLHIISRRPDACLVWMSLMSTFFSQTIVLWSCRHVTGSGLLILVNKCQKLKSIDVWGTRVPLDCFIGLLAISPALQIKPKELQLNIERVSMVPV